MAKENNRNTELKQQLIREMNAQRTILASRAGSLDFSVREKVRQVTDFPTLCKNAISRHPLAWASASVIAAFAATRLLLGSSPGKKEKSPSIRPRSALTVSAVLGFVGKSAFKALRPVVEKAIRERISYTLGTPAPPPHNP